jgi:uncharacterized membrane protein YbhN (UPF0104 family)
VTCPPARAGPAPFAGASAVRRQVLTLVLLAALTGALLLAVPGLDPVVREIGDMSPGWVLAAAAFELASCLSFVVLFGLLFEIEAPRDARELGWTSLGAGALLPAGGIGGLAIGAWALSLTGAATAWVLRRSTALFLLTSAVNVVTVVPAALVWSAHGGGTDAVLPLLGACALLAAAAFVARRAAPVARAGRPAWIGHIGVGVHDAWRILLAPRWRLAGALGYLWFDIAALWAVFAATGHVPPLAALVLGYLIGQLANALPVPGGIGVLDAGLAAALVLYGADPAAAIAAVLVYHALVSWIAGIGGLLAFASLRRRLRAAA